MVKGRRNSMILHQKRVAWWHSQQSVFILQCSDGVHLSLVITTATYLTYVYFPLHLINYTQNTAI